MRSVVSYTEQLILPFSLSTDQDCSRCKIMGYPIPDELVFLIQWFPDLFVASYL